MACIFELDVAFSLASMEYFFLNEAKALTYVWRDSHRYFKVQTVERSTRLN